MAAEIGHNGGPALDEPEITDEHLATLFDWWRYKQKCRRWASHDPKQYASAAAAAEESEWAYRNAVEKQLLQKREKSKCSLTRYH